MDGTGVLDGEDAVDRDVRDHAEVDAPYPQPLASVRLGDVRTYRIVDDEDEPVLVVSDGEISIEFACGLSGLSDPAAQGAQRLADAVREYASAIAATLRQ